MSTNDDFARLMAEAAPNVLKLSGLCERCGSNLDAKGLCVAMCDLRKPDGSHNRGLCACLQCWPSDGN